MALFTLQQQSFIVVTDCEGSQSPKYVPSDPLGDSSLTHILLPRLTTSLDSSNLPSKPLTSHHVTPLVQPILPSYGNSFTSLSLLLSRLQGLISSFQSTDHVLCTCGQLLTGILSMLLPTGNKLTVSFLSSGQILHDNVKYVTLLEFAHYKHAIKLQLDHC